MTKPIKLVIDCSTGITSEVELTDEEIAQLEIDKANETARKTEEQAQAEALAELKTSAKAKLVAGEPLTAEEAATIVL
jgi:hypothetical protein